MFEEALEHQITFRLVRLSEGVRVEGTEIESLTAIGEYRKVVELDAKNSGALYNLALVYERVDPKESIVLWECYIQLAGPQPTEKDWVDVAKLHLRKLKSQFDKEK